MNIVLSNDLYAEAATAGVTMSQLLERKYPAAEGSKLTAFQRALKQQNILTKSAPAKGFSADKVEAFYQTNENKVLFPEFVATNMREELMMESILQYLVATVTTIDSNVYRSSTIKFDETYNKRGAKLRRVAEGAEIPKAKIVLGEKAINIIKYGIALEATYEAIRRMKIDLLARHIRFIAIQQSLDETDTVLDILVNGDGNKGTASPRYELSTLDTAATGGVITRKGWLSFLMKFFPYGANTVVGNEAAILNLLEMLAPDNMNQIMDSLSANPSINLTIRTPQGLFRQINAIYYPGAPQIEISGTKYDALYALNSEYGVEKVIEAGSDITEADRFITRQTEVLTISENAGFASMYPQATGILILK